MTEGRSIYLIFKSKKFLIPTGSSFLNRINSNICSILFENHNYVVKSIVSDDIFDSFFNYCVSNSIPDICNKNISEFQQLSQEFGVLKDIIQTYQKFNLESKLPSLNEKNYVLKQILYANNCEIEEKTKKYHQIINHLFNNHGIDTTSRFNEVKDELLDACNQGNIKFVDLLTKKEVKQNNLSFLLNEEEKTAGVFRNLHLDDSEIYIPRSIQHENQEFVITIIYENCFKNASTIKFSEDSQLISIDKCSFSDSPLESIRIPKHVKTIGEAAFASCYKLNNVEFDENSELELIDDYSFYYSSIKSMTIPSHVKRIGELAFYYCTEFKTVTFSENSELETIEKSAFSSTSIEFIRIPFKVKKIGDWSFSFCNNLKTIDFSNALCLNSIEENLFSNSPIEEISLPSNVECFADGWCNATDSLTKFKVIQKERQNIISLDDTFIIGKSDVNKDIYDVLLFARRDVEKVTIPSFIKKIASYSFQFCSKLKSIEFPEDSKLETISKYAFSSSSVESIRIPQHVYKIEDHAFYDCRRLKRIEFTRESQLKQIEDCAFSYSSLTKISIPKHVVKIGECAFSQCSHLEYVDFPNKSELTSIGERAFSGSSLKSIVIPENVSNISDGAFSECMNLQVIEISNDSKLKLIRKSICLESPQANLMISDVMQKNNLK